MTARGTQNGLAADRSRATRHSSRKTRETWVSTAWALLEHGTAPIEMSLDDLCAAVNMSKGSFYNHFPGKLDELHRCVLDRWVASYDLEKLDHSMRTIQDPLDRLRLIAGQVLQAAHRDRAVRRWADRDDRVATTVAKVDHALIAHMTQAMTALGLSGPDSAMRARTLMAWLIGISQIVRVRNEAADLDPLLSLLRDGGEGKAADWKVADWRAAAVTAVIRSREADASGWILFMQALGLAPEDRLELAQIAREFINRQDPGGSAGRADPAQAG